LAAVGKGEGLDLGFHSLRHTAVLLLKYAGAADAVDMALLGHEPSLHSRRQRSEPQKRFPKSKSFKQ
jgi:integrase